MSTLPSASLIGPSFLPGTLAALGGLGVRTTGRAGFNDDDAMLREAEMAMPEEWISGLEGKADDHARGIAQLQGLIGGLDGKVDRRMDAIDHTLARGRGTS